MVLKLSYYSLIENMFSWILLKILLFNNDLGLETLFRYFAVSQFAWQEANRIPYCTNCPHHFQGIKFSPFRTCRYILAFAYAHCSVQTLKPSCTIHSTASNTSFTWMRPVHIKSLPIGSWMPSFGFPTSFKSVLILILCRKAKGKNCKIRERKLQLLLTINCDLFADKSPPNLLSM